MARSTAAAAPAITTCPGALKLTALTTSPGLPRHRPPTIGVFQAKDRRPCRPARRDRLLHQLFRSTSLTASANARLSAATSAEYSPRLCPATNARRAPPSASQAPGAIETVRMAGWVLSVWFRRSSGPFLDQRPRVVTERLGGLGEGIAHQRLLERPARPACRGIANWPGKTNARDADVNRSLVVFCSSEITRQPRLAQETECWMAAWTARSHVEAADARDSHAIVAAGFPGLQCATQGALEALLGGRPMAFHHYPLQSEETGAVIACRSDIAAQPAQQRQRQRTDQLRRQSISGSAVRSAPTP